MSHLMHELISVENGDIEDALRFISENDNDFTGENGDDYLWDEAREKGYASNQDYLIDQIKEIDGDIQKIEYFIENWVGHDSYYQEYSWDCITDENNNVTVISFEALTGY